MKKKKENQTIILLSEKKTEKATFMRELSDWEIAEQFAKKHANDFSAIFTKNVFTEEV